MLLWLLSPSFAYETDQITWRERELRDSTEEANAVINILLQRAVERTNERTQCEGTDDELRFTLAEQIHDTTSRARGVWERKGLRAAGFTVFSASLERAPSVDKFSFAHREDIYGGLTLWHSVVLTLAGPCSTFEVAGVRLGSDKFDHFLDVGFYYLRDERRTGSVTRALQRGTATERSIYGLLTSKTFSFADLRANYDGYLFYRSLLSEGSELRRGSDGCVEAVRPFDWRDWVRPEWDEVINPPVYTRLVERGVLSLLQERREEVCAAWRWWGSEAMDVSSERARYVVGPAPSPRDPWQLEALCAGDRSSPLSPSPVRPREELKQQKRLK